ncbi:MAG: ABC transporter substrate-binding protein [Candidatus Methanosuratincola petrocarbonis]
MRWAVLSLFVALAASFAAMPGIASSYTLGIFGNANMDDSINELDIAYVEGIINGTYDPTRLADANYDGKVNAKDIEHIQHIIKGDESTLTIIDTANRTVTLKMPIDRIVALTDDSAEALRVLHSIDKVVGVSIETLENSAYLPEFSQLPNVGKWSEPDIEKILLMEPDLVISYKSATSKYLEPMLNDTGISIVALDLYRANDLPAEMKMLGYIVNKTTEADSYLGWFNRVTDVVSEKISEIPENKRTRVYLEGASDLKTYTKGRGADLVCTMAGGVNIASELTGLYPEVESEWVIAQNPEVIVRLTQPSEIPCGYATDDPSGFETKRRELLTRTGWSNITAVKEGRVYLLLYEFGASPGVPVAIAYLAKWFYPELFEDLNPQAVHQEYLELQGFDYDLKNHGVFVYPSMEGN